MTPAHALTRRHLLHAGGLALAALAVRPVSARAQPPSAGPADSKLIEDLVAANRILVDQGVLDGYGHVSVRHDRDPNRYLMSRSIAPELVTVADVMEYDLDSVPVDPRGRATYLERFIHGEIYKVRPDVKAVVHNHSPSVIPFGATGAPLRPLYHMSAFLSGGVPVFDIRAATGQMTDMLVRDPALGRALAQSLGDRPVALMRGHGAVVVGQDLRATVYTAVYLELNARLQMQAEAMGKVKFLTKGEAEKVAATTTPANVNRAWENWCRKAERPYRE